jgi:glycine/D-amino acid oxidase-like deaminating enzyme
MAGLEPNVDFTGAQQVAFSANDGAVDPVIATRLLLAAAESYGATVKYPAELTNVLHHDGRLTEIETSAGSFETDRLVLATGAAANAGKLFADSDVPQRSTPGIIAITKPLPRCVYRVIAAPGIHLHQRDDGRVVLGEQEGAPQNEAHATRLTGRPNDFPVREIAEQHAGRMLDVAKRFVPLMAAAELENVYIGWRPLPLDGHPVLGVSTARPDVYLAIMHSGVSLAPIVGQLAAHELIHDVAIERLDEFRPDRDFQFVKRY